MHCLAIMWAAAIGGGIYERAVKYSRTDDDTNKLKVQFDRTYRHNFDIPELAEIIIKQGACPTKIPGLDINKVGWNNAKYLHGINYASFCITESEPLDQLLKLVYEPLEIWKPTWDSRALSKDRQLYGSLQNILEVDTEGMLRYLLSSARAGEVQLIGSLGYFPPYRPRQNTRQVQISNGVMLGVVRENRFVDKLQLGNTAYTFIVDKLYGFTIAIIDKTKLNYSPDNFIKFLEESYTLHNWAGVTRPLVSKRYASQFYVI